MQLMQSSSTRCINGINVYKFFLACALPIKQKVVWVQSETIMSIFGVPSQRKRQWVEEDYDLHVFDLNHTGGWGNLLELNGGESAPCLTAAPGKLHKLYMCCLVLRYDAAAQSKKKRRQLQALQQECGDEEWWPYATRIAIVVPVALQSGIAMAQGIKRLERTCPCDHLRGLGMALLASVVRHFTVEYLFMSPIDSFADHVRRELVARDIPFGRLGARSLWWAVSNRDEEDGKQWLTVKEGVLKYAEKGRFVESEVYYLKICPQSPFDGVCRERTLLLNHSYYVPRGGHCDPDYEPPPHIKYETHDFLWFLAGDGVLVIHGPSLA